MMQDVQEDRGITYGALLGFLIASSLTLGLTGSAGYFLAKAVHSTPESVSSVPGEQQRPVKTPASIPSSTGETVSEAGGNPFSVR
jgi:hypothetical protein